MPYFFIVNMTLNIIQQVIRMRKKYFVIVAATLMICAVAGLSAIEGTTETMSTRLDSAIPDNKMVQPKINVIPVEYIDFEPYYITAKVGKNEG